MKKVTLAPNLAKRQDGDPEGRHRWEVRVFSLDDRLVATLPFMSPGKFDYMNFLGCVIDDARTARDYTAEDIADDLLDRSQYDSVRDLMKAARALLSACRTAKDALDGAFWHIGGEVSASDKLLATDDMVLDRYLRLAVEVDGVNKTNTA